MLLTTIFLVAFFAMLLAIIITAIRHPSRRRQALQGAGLIILMGLTFTITELPSRFPQVPIRVWGGLGIGLVASAYLCFFLQDLWAGLVWRQAAARNLGALAFMATITTVTIFNYIPLVVIAWFLLMVGMFAVGWALSRSSR